MITRICQINKTIIVLEKYWLFHVINKMRTYVFDKYFGMSKTQNTLYINHMISWDGNFCKAVSNMFILLLRFCEKKIPKYICVKYTNLAYGNVFSPVGTNLVLLIIAVHQTFIFSRACSIKTNKVMHTWNLLR